MSDLIVIDDKVNISENNLRDKMSSIFNILLIDRTKSTKRCIKNIIWANENYIKYDAKKYSATSEIKIELITGEYSNVIQPRALKAAQLQKKRTRTIAEVFTPIEILKQQNDEIDKSCQNDDLETYTKRTWIEITCGEAPYIATRYNVITGKLIDLDERVGFLDRKLRKINKECNIKDKWKELVREAYKASYGFEWNGDSLLLARENLLYTYFDYYDNKTILPGQNMTNAAYMEGVKRFCEKFADKYFKINGSKNAVDTASDENDRRNIIFSGNTGVGKTYLSNCIAKVLLDRYYSVIYLSAKELFEALVKVKMEKSEDQKYLLLIEEVYESDMLIIDDLGTELSNHFTTTEFFHIINRRVNTEKSTIISTNLSLDEMRDIYSERVTSRIRKSFMYIRLFGNDIRAKL